MSESEMDGHSLLGAMRSMLGGRPYTADATALSHRLNLLKHGAAYTVSYIETTAFEKSSG